MDCILMSTCMWCGETFIKDKIGQTHGCEAEKNPSVHKVDAAPIEEVAESINLMRR